MPASATSNALQLHMSGSRYPLLMPGLALALTFAAAVWLLAEPLREVLRGTPLTLSGAVPPAASATVPPSPATDYRKLSASTLFGRYDPAAMTAGATPDPAASAMPDSAPEALPEANLGAALTGVLYAPRAQDRRAIIAVAGGQPTAYAIDARLPGDAVIRFIEARRIVVEHDGELKAVSLAESELGDTAAAPAAQDAAADLALPQAASNATAARVLALRRRAAAAQP